VVGEPIATVGDEEEDPSHEDDPESEAQDHFDLEYGGDDGGDGEGMAALGAEAPVATQEEGPLLPVVVGIQSTSSHLHK